MLDRLVIEETKAATVFSNGRQRKIVLALVAQARSLGELARLTETPLSLLHHHVGRFAKLGLITTEREEPRAGTPLKFYRAVAREFFVPAELMAKLPGVGLNQRLRDALNHSLSTAIEGVSFDCENGAPRMRLVKSSDLLKVSAELWLELQLSKTDAAALASELSHLLQSFKSRSNEIGKRYIVHAAVAPVD